jgi:hypothetical protein
MHNHANVAAAILQLTVLRLDLVPLLTIVAGQLIRSPCIDHLTTVVVIESATQATAAVTVLVELLQCTALGRRSVYVARLAGWPPSV